MCIRDSLDGIHVERRQRQQVAVRRLADVYKRQHLVQASTRGDGHVGEDVTANVAALSCLPYSIELPEGINKIELRGECYMSEKDFEATNAKQAEAGKKLLDVYKRQAANSSCSKMSRTAT